VSWYAGSGPILIGPRTPTWAVLSSSPRRDGASPFTSDSRPSRKIDAEDETAALPRARILGQLTLLRDCGTPRHPGLRDPEDQWMERAKS